MRRVCVMGLVSLAALCIGCGKAAKPPPAKVLAKVRDDLAEEIVYSELPVRGPGGPATRNSDK